MIKREIVNKIAKRVGLPQQLVKRIIEELLTELREALVRGERIEIRNFGVFRVKVTRAKIGRNPQTGESISLPAKRKVTFKPGKLLKRMVS
ncbi:MAG: integration host factor subunit beta [Candidatus Omnitrophica bacterium]|nr:integration host factor subunit beta [Candidatus Omnitrophota bacterium]